jgi:hypothetical protein
MHGFKKRCIRRVILSDKNLQKSTGRLNFAGLNSVFMGAARKGKPARAALTEKRGSGGNATDLQHNPAANKLHGNEKKHFYFMHRTPDGFSGIRTGQKRWNIGRNAPANQTVL